MSNKKHDQIISKRHSQGFATGIFGLIMNLVLATMKVVAGVFSGSIAVLSDGINNLIDASSSVVVIIGFRAPTQGSSDKPRPHGRGRTSYIISMIVSFFIFIGVLYLARTSIARIIQPEPVNFNNIVLAIMAISVFVKLFMAGFYTWRNRTLKSSLISAAIRDSMSDALLSALVFFAANIARSTNFAVDGAVGLVVVAFIAYQSIRAFLDSLDLLLGRSAHPDKLEGIEKIVLKYPAFTEVVGIDYHDYGDSYQRAYIKVKVKPRLPSAEVRRAIDDVRLDLLNLQNVKATIVYWH
ncbi:cation diffusion facilitator family transporter [Candidatus Saccharibacteria bacterium]|nr:cation diffusion facilitator family transporter [Candidatus Saccharibacteria bacterium]